MNQKLEKPYDPKETEARIYKRWEESGFFNPDNLPAHDGAPFSIVLPPPNVTGTLHMGSALMLAVEDALVRYHRMKGDKTLWLPGTDSAAIATQTKVEKEIQKKEGVSRHDLGREELLRRIDGFVEETKATILGQIRAMGSSVDWSRYAYTMDEARYHAVMTAFVKMHEAGLIYRGTRVVNWDPKGQTTISDDEIVYEERQGKLYTFKYSKDFPFAIATTRPETKVGDTAVAVHPDDPRYREYVGKEYDAVFCDVPVHIKIIADESVDKEYGTGALGVTPAHSQTDADIAARHGLPAPQVINEYAKMSVAGRLEGKKTAEARELVVAWLKDEGLLEKEEDVAQNIATAERTGGTVEPLPKLQWFIAVNKEFPLPHSEIPGIASGSMTTLKKIMRAAVESGAVRILSERFLKTYFHWIDNLRDWCISRQIWFGHRVPVFYCIRNSKQGISNSKFLISNQIPDSGKCGAPIVSIEPIKKCPHCDGEVAQDPDVLDTWFSSALWTFSTLGWPTFAETAAAGKPGHENDLANYHPTSVIETGYDILFFWVARMILMSGFFLGTVPFKTVYLHGLVRDEQGRKISKSLGNNIDPVYMIEKYGADAVRMSLLVGTAPGTDSTISEAKIRGYKHFANKIWNITRFVMEHSAGAETGAPDTMLVQDFRKIVAEITADIEGYRLHLASEKLYAFVWHEFADKIIEESKPVLSGTDEAARKARATELSFIWTQCVKLLHPFMPFITEEIWGMLPESHKTQQMLMVEKWPLQKS